MPTAQLILRVQHNSNGATMIEYVLALAMLLVLFIGMNEWLLQSAENRAEQSANVVSNMAPCGGNLFNDRCF